MHIVLGQVDQYVIQVRKHFIIVNVRAAYILLNIHVKLDFVFFDLLVNDLEQMLPVLIHCNHVFFE